MKRRLSLLIGLAIIAPACTDPEPQPLPPPVVMKPDMTSGTEDMAPSADMSDMADMSADMTTPVDMNVPEDMGAPEDMSMPEDMGMDMPVDMCEPKTEVELCAEYGFECGKLEVMECGQMRVVENCGGGCPAPSLCEQTEENGAITGSLCRCDESNADQICDNVGKLCGQIDNLPPGVCDTLPACSAYCVDSMEAGNTFNCAIGSGKLRCWGENRSGQLGLGDTTARKNPDDQIALSLPVLQVAAGGAHTCAILEDLSLICWGENGKGQLGVGTSVSTEAPDLSDANSRAFPKDTGIAKVVTGNEHTCALIDTDFVAGMGATPQAPYSVYCWGNNELGIVGNTNYSVNSTIGVPVLVDGLLDNVYDIAAGSQHTCAIVSAEDMANPTARDVVCWGSANESQNGSHTIVAMPNKPSYPYIDAYQEGLDDLFFVAPVKVQDPAHEDIKVLTEIAPGKVDGTIFPPQTGHPFRGEFKAITAGRTFTCVIDGNDEVWCWGLMPFDHANGTCEDPNKEAEPSDCTIWPPNNLWPGNNASRVWPIAPIIDQNRDNTDKTRRPETSGNKQGLPAGPLRYIASAARPVRVAHQSDPLALPTGVMAGANVKATHFAAHNEHICMLVNEQSTSKTNVYCLGHNQFGEVGNGTNSPTKFADPIRGDVNGNVVRATQLSLGDRHSCAVVDDNNIKCWGSNRASQIGNENLLQDESFRPFDVLLR